MSIQKVPGFIVIGPQRTGTTWLYNYFLTRGDICLPRGVKETFFFDKKYAKGLKWYSDHFTACMESDLIAEVAPTYFHSTHATDRIKQALGNIKLISILREPVERTYSMYLLYRRYGVVGKDLRASLEPFPEILDSGRYATHLKRWFRDFGRENVHIAFFEELNSNTDAFVRSINDFLGIEHKKLDPTLNRQINKAALPQHPRLARFGLWVADTLRDKGIYKAVTLAKDLGLKEFFFGSPEGLDLPQMSVEDNIWLKEYFTDEIIELQNLLDRDLTSWREVKEQPPYDNTSSGTAREADSQG